MTDYINARRTAALTTLIAGPLAAGALLLSAPAAHAEPTPPGTGGTIDLLDSKTNSDIKSKLPKDLVDITAIIGSLDKLTDKLKTKADTMAKTAIGDTAKVGNN